jgi:phage-related minor tail protein
MKNARKGEIALLFIKHIMQKNGFRLSEKSFSEGLKEFSKATGVSEKETKEFAETIIREYMENVFNNT